MCVIRNAVVVALVLLASSTAYAGEAEKLVQVAVDPNDPDVMAVRYINGGEGLLLTRDGGKTFSITCAGAIFQLSGERAPGVGRMAFGGDGALLLPMFYGMFADDAASCGWSTEPFFSERYVKDMTVLPSDPRIVYAVTSNGGVENSVSRRNADGTWTELGKDPIPPTRVLVTELPDGRVRIYESAFDAQIEKMRDDGSVYYVPSNVMRMSEDDGATWTSNTIGELDGNFELQAIDPTNPDRVIVTLNRDKPEGESVRDPDSVLVTEDLGVTFTEIAEVSDFGGLAMDDEGGMWLGDTGDSFRPGSPQGLLRASDLASDFERVLESPITCVHLAGDELRVCQRFGFGRVDTATGEYEELVHVRDVQAVTECEGYDIAAMCRSQLCGTYCNWDHFWDAPACVDAYETTDAGCPAASVAPVDAGVADAGMEEVDPSLDDAGMPSDGGSSGCACTVIAPSGRGASARAFACLSLAALWIGLRRRTRR